MMWKFAIFSLFIDAISGCRVRYEEYRNPKEYTSVVLLHEEAIEMTSFPKHYDWCELGMCTPSWNQHVPLYCGACFVHGTLSSIQDRIRLKHKKDNYTGADVMLGRQSFLNCAPGHGYSEGCQGGSAGDIFRFMQKYGLPDETCLSYNATDYSKYTHTNGTCPPEGYCLK